MAGEMTIKRLQDTVRRRGYSLRKTRNADHYTLRHVRTGFLITQGNEEQLLWHVREGSLLRYLRRV